MKLITFFFFLVLVSCNRQQPVTENQSKDSINSNPSHLKDTLSFSFVGDIMMGSNHNGNDLPPNDGKDLYAGVSEYLKSTDLTFGNLEGPLLDKGGTPKNCRPGSKCIAFRTPVRYAEYLKDAGFDGLAIANNHANDMGEIGRKSTAKTLDEYGIIYGGTYDYPYSFMKYDSLTIGFTAFAPNVNCLNLNDIDYAKKLIQKLNDSCDILIVSFHGGAEGGANRVPRRNETYLNENRGDVFKFARTMIDAGADIIYGHGPHVTRGMEVYKGKFIAYSLGNFCTYGKFSLAGEQGIAPILQIYTDRKGNFLHGDIIPIKQIKRGFPVLDESSKVISTIQRLSKLDFPESNLNISDEAELIIN